MDSRGWVGINLGQSDRSPGAYHIWVPSFDRIVIALQVYFNERYFPWLPPKPSGPIIASCADGDVAQPPVLPPPSHAAADAALPGPRHFAPAATTSAAENDSQNLRHSAKA
eukprot:804772-Pleurochrysis_carterae.AAC.4